MMAAPIVSAGSSRELVAVVQYTDARAGLTERAATLKMCLECQIYHSAKRLRSFADSKKLALQEPIGPLPNDAAVLGAIARPQGSQFFFPLELLRLSVFTGASSHAASIAGSNSRSTVSDSLYFDWTMVAAYAGAATAGALRGSAALLLLSKNGADVTGRIFKYRGDNCTVR
jgi:hypothetical protein